MMKKRVISLVLVSVLCMMLALTAYAAPNESFVLDDASLLSDSEAATLNAKLQSVSDTYQAQITVVTVASTDWEDIDEFTRQLYKELELGYGSSKDGVLLMVCMDPRQYRVLSNGMAADAIDEVAIDSIGSAISYELTEGNYAEAFTAFADECQYYLDGHLNGFPFPVGVNLLIALVVGLVAGLIVALILKGQLKSVHRQNQANVYIKTGSMQLTASNDLFLYRTVDRRRKERSSSSSSGSSGSSRQNIGGGSF